MLIGPSLANWLWSANHDLIKNSLVLKPRPCRTALYGKIAVVAKTLIGG
ncbi:hypothetical protein ACE1CI_15670 [Aerosakkonemataceae cyanobacterium BLCC-F50]|uniref:Uncharacterized protein n=1 Tax=Floridaenema flaviceps BLCC-F50 TaxID=3153642 RepID=A0ABV4XRQ0_9CYAN